jgi:hypothetical protein
MTNFQRGYGEILPDWAPPDEEYVTEKTAKRKARTAFWRGSIFGALLATGAFVASAAWGETVHIGGIYINGSQQTGTTVTIEPSTEPGQLATVTLDNKHVNDAGDNAEYFIGIPGLAVGVEFQWDSDGFSGADRITVRPPEGITCLPADCSVTVMEGFTGTVVLLDWIGS